MKKSTTKEWNGWAGHVLFQWRILFYRGVGFLHGILILGALRSHSNFLVWFLLLLLFLVVGFKFYERAVLDLYFLPLLINTRFYYKFIFTPLFFPPPPPLPSLKQEFHNNPTQLISFLSILLFGMEEFNFLKC